MLERAFVEHGYKLRTRPEGPFHTPWGKPTDEFFNRSYNDVKDLVEHWEETYGPDDYGCAQMLRAMSRVIYDQDDDPENRELEV